MNSNRHNFNSRPVGPLCHFKHIINEKKERKKITQRQKVNKDIIENIYTYVSEKTPLYVDILFIVWKSSRKNEKKILVKGNGN